MKSTPLVAAAVVALGLCGCSDTTKPRMAEPSSGSITTSPTQVTAEPPSGSDVPTAAREKSIPGAEAFVSHFWDVADEALISKDSTAVSKLVSAQCEPCQAVIKVIESYRSEDARVRGGTTTISNVESTRLGSAERSFYDIQVQFDLTNTRQIVEFPGRRPEVFPAGKVRDSFIVSWVDGRWTLADWQVLQ